MKSILIFSPPGWSIFVPSCAGPMLAGYLRAREVFADVMDLNSLYLADIIDNINRRNIKPEQIRSLNRIALNEFIEKVDLTCFYGKSELELTLEDMFSITSSELSDFIETKLAARYNHIKRFEVFGISVSLTRQLYSAMVISRTLKAYFPERTVVIGGSAISSLWEPILNSKEFFDYFDLVVKEDGTTPLLEILNGHPVEEIHSIAFRKGDDIFLNNLSRIPDDLYFYPPLYHSEFIENYPKPLVLAVPSNIGCYHNKCAFCTYPSAKKFRYKFWGEHAIVNTLETLQSQLGVNAFYFTGAGLTPMHFKQVAQLINKRGLQLNWSSESLATRIEPETMSEIKQSGCIQLDFGLESASKPIRDFLKKGIKLDNLRYTLDNIRKTRFRGTTFNLILSTPITSKDNLSETVEFLKEYEDIIFCTYQFNLEIQLSSDYYQSFHNFSNTVMQTRPDTLVRLFPYQNMDESLMAYWIEEFDKLNIGGLYTREKRIDGGLIDIALCISQDSRQQWQEMRLLLKEIDNTDTISKEPLLTTRFL